MLITALKMPPLKKKLFLLLLFSSSSASFFLSCPSGPVLWLNTLNLQVFVLPQHDSQAAVWALNAMPSNLFCFLCSRDSNSIAGCLQQGQNFSLLKGILTSSGAHVAFYSLGNKQILPPLVNQPPSTAKDKHEWSFTSKPPAPHTSSQNAQEQLYAFLFIRGTFKF